MNKAHVLVVTDNADYAGQVVARILPGAGFQATLADDNTPPPPVDVVLVDVDRVLVSPLTGLQAQRRLGCKAPALLVAPRLNEAMAAQMFELNIRDFLTKPADEDILLEKLKKVLELTRMERGTQELGERLRMQESAMQRRLTEMETLSAIGRALTTVESAETILKRIVDAAVYLSGAEEGALFLADEAGKLYVRAQKNLGQQEVQVLNTLSEDSIASQVFQTGEAMIQAGEEDELKIKTGYLVRALITVPIVVGSHIVGVLAVYNHSSNPFEESDKNTLTTLSDYAGLALSKMDAVAQLQERLEEASEASRKALLHMETMHSPLEAMEAQVSLLLSGKPGPVTEAQSDALNRIHLSIVRLKEIGEFVRGLAQESK